MEALWHSFPSVLDLIHSEGQFPLIGAFDWDGPETVLYVEHHKPSRFVEICDNNVDGFATIGVALGNTLFRR